jgi:hypothetical protein
MNEPQEAIPPASGRLALLRDILVFQVKLLVDGLRDVLLVPVSVVAGLLALMSGPTPGSQFHDLLRLGRKSEQWINLFGAADAPGAGRDSDVPPGDIDDLMARMEAFVVDEYRHGGVTAQARERLARALDSLRSRRKDRPSD